MRTSATYYFDREAKISEVCIEDGFPNIDKIGIEFRADDRQHYVRISGISVEECEFLVKRLTKAIKHIKDEQNLNRRLRARNPKDNTRKLETKVKNRKPTNRNH